MVLKLYGVALATCTQRVIVVLKEKNIPFELVNVDFSTSEQKSPAYREKQPFGLIPYLDDDGFILFESRAIMRYIADKYRDQGTPLLPDREDLKGNALLEQAINIELNNFEPSAGPIVKELYGKR